jgi:PAS domain S-box-containing protein
LFAVSELWGKLTKPSEAIKASDDRQRAQLLTSLLVAMWIITFLGVPAGHLWDGTEDLLFVLLFLSVAYGISRTQHYIYGAILTVIGLCIPSVLGLFLISNSPSPQMSSALMWLSLPLVIGSLVFPIRILSLVIVTIIAGLLSATFFLEIAFTEYLEVLAFLGSMSIFLSMAARIRHIEVIRRKDAEESVLTLSQAIEQSSTSVIITDTDGSIKYVNPRFCEISGFTSQEVVGKNPRILQSGKTPLKEYENLWETIVAGKVWYGELSNKRKTGELYWEATSISSIKDDDDNIKYFLAIKEDITERKQAEAALHQYAAELENRNEELDAFAHTVAHDLKNPLGVTIFNAEMLISYSNEMSKEKIERYLNTIQTKGHLMNNIIDELLFLAKVRKEEVVSEPLDMAAIISAVQLRMQETIQEHQAEIRLPPSWPVALGHPAWIEEVWANYLDNALKYGGNPLLIELGASTLSDGVKFWIRDNGEGLTIDEQERLYTPFTQLEQSLNRGHGLGLSIVNRIVEKLCGEVGVESSPGAGSTFWFKLPK